MRKVNHTGLLAYMLVVCLLLFSVNTPRHYMPEDCESAHELVITQKSGLLPPSESQLLFEEQEGPSERDCNDEQDESQDNLFFICQLSKSTVMTIVEPTRSVMSDIPPSFGDTTDLPLYLAKHAFLI